MIARESAAVKTDELEVRTLPAGTYAAFKTECGGLAWEEFSKLFAFARRTITTRYGFL